MTEKLVIDYAWTHPDPHKIRAAGIHGVMRYLSTDSSKNITAAEAKALHAAHLGIGLVWESTANRAGQGGNAGRADALAAAKQADALRYPKSRPLFYAVDYDAEPAAVFPYFRAAKKASARPVGVYGSKRVVEAVMKAGLAEYGWQTVAWSGGEVSKVAHLYQRLKPTARIVGAAGGWDENVVLHDFPMWKPPRKRISQKPAHKPAPAPAPVEKVDPQPAKADAKTTTRPERAATNLEHVQGKRRQRKAGRVLDLLHRLFRRTRNER